MRATKFLFWAMALIAVACSDDSNGNQQTPAQEIANLYSGYESETFFNNVTITDNKNLTVTANEDGTVNVDYSSNSFGTFSVTGAEVVKSGDSYSVNGDGVISLGMNGANENEYNFTLSAILDGNEKAFTFNLGIMGGVEIVFIVGEYTESVVEPVSQRMTVDASDYSKWVYINLETGETESVRDFSAWNYLNENDEVVETTSAMGGEEDITIDWHIAIHREDIRTNGATVVATGVTSFDALTEIPADGYMPDETVENSVITDMSYMMSGKVAYAETSLINKTLCGWIEKVPTGSMPPYTYNYPKLVYVAKFADGSYAKLQFTDRSNDMGVSGHITFASEYYK